MDNVELVNPVEIKKRKVFFVGNKNDACPHCNAENSLHYKFDHFDPISDYVYKRYVCDKCTADVDTI